MKFIIIFIPILAAVLILGCIRIFSDIEKNNDPHNRKLK